MLPLEGRVAVVTGAYGRLGPVWCSALLDAGARVVGLDRPEARPSPAFTALERTAGGRLRAYPADVLDRAALEAARGRCEAEVGEPSVLVNNAGIDQPPGAAITYRVEDMPLELFRGVLDVNVAGAFQVSQVFGPAGVRVNALSPGGVEGGQDLEFKRKFASRVPLGRMAAPDDLRGPLIFLASDMSSYVTGIELRVDGGFTAW
jgi:NAD(P)-dependent dehydrogenase (short-subunit alcohol dehydrogenase family)